VLSEGLEHGRFPGARAAVGSPEGSPHIPRIANNTEESDMQVMDIQEHARKLREARGDLALVQAAQKARHFEQQGDTKPAETWRRIEAALRQMQGPRVS
jgi:hypothetical protein